jgi:ABC-type Na+ efflux pump permease subunit
MKRFTLPLVALALVSLTLNTANAQNKKPGKDVLTAKIKKQLQAAELPADVLEKCNKIVAEMAPKVAEAQSKVDAVLTAEQQQARAAAQKAAKEAGKKKKEAQAEVEAATKLTDEQKSKLAAANKELTAAQTALTDGLKAALTPEQQAKVLGKVKKKQG